MIRIIDATLAYVDAYDPSKEQLYLFCSLIQDIGITDLEISRKVYEKLGLMPKDIRFYLAIDRLEDKRKYPGIYKFIYDDGVNTDNGMVEIKIADAGDLTKLNTYKQFSYLRITGLDNLLFYNYMLLFQDVKQCLTRSRVNFAPGNHYKCGSGCAAIWGINGGSEVTTSFNGLGEKAPTEEVIMALRLTAHYKPNQKMSALPELSRLSEEITKMKIPRNKPILGSHIFFVETDTHADGILNNPSNYEPYPAEIIGQKIKSERL